MEVHRLTLTGKGWRKKPRGKSGKKIGLKYDGEKKDATPSRRVAATIKHITIVNDDCQNLCLCYEHHE